MLVHERRTAQAAEGFNSVSVRARRGHLRARKLSHGVREAMVLLAAAVLGGGCSQTRQYQPAVNPDTLSDAQFVHYLETVPVVTFAEACRAVLVAADGEDKFKSHPERYAELRGRGIVREAWKISPDQVLDLGTLAFMAAKACQLPPSVGSILLGSWGPGDRRYALRQAAGHGIVERGQPYKLVAGGEMLLVLARMDEYMAAAGIYDFAGEDINAPDEVANLE